VLKVITTDAEFEYTSDEEDEWLSELETRAIDLENDISDWRESRQRPRPERAGRPVPSPGWPRDARYVESDPDPYDYEAETNNSTSRSAGDRGPRSRVEAAPVPGRASRRSPEPAPAPDSGRAAPRAARYGAEQDVEEDAGPRRARAGRQTGEPDPSRESDARRAGASRRTADPELDDAGPTIPRASRYTVDPDTSYAGDPTFPRTTRHTGERTRRASAGHGWLADERTQLLIARGRRSAVRGRLARARNITIGVGIGTVLAIVLLMVVFRQGASWPPSVATVQSEITTACQNPNVASEPNQVNFACGKTTAQVLWVFALLTSGDNPSFANAKSGRKGLEPITPAQGGEVAWSLDLHHPYDPLNPIDSIEVAARAINNIIGGASLTDGNGKPFVQAGLLSNPANCYRYTGSSAVIARAGFPDVCAEQVTTPAGQAALVADVFGQWLVGAPATNAQEASILFENANNPGNPQVQAILRTLPGASATG
jgi:hypothetical protein